MEKIEFGGIKGKVLSAQTVQIFDEFNELYKVFQEFTGDPLDPKEPVSYHIAIELILNSDFLKKLHLQMWLSVSFFN